MILLLCKTCTVAEWWHQACYCGGKKVADSEPEPDESCVNYRNKVVAHLISSRGSFSGKSKNAEKVRV